MIDLKSMTLKELKEQKMEWWQLAVENGSVAMCGSVCREFGEQLRTRYGPKYVYVEGDLKLYVDDYEHFSLVLWKGKIVMSTHMSDQFFIPGKWFDIVRYRAICALYNRMKEETNNETGNEDTEREKLLLQLSG